MPAGSHLHHVHARKRFHHKNLRPYPAKHPWYRFLDQLVYVVAVISPLSAVPQIMKLWNGESDGVSVLSWLIFGLVAAIWLLYGFAHKEWPIIVSNTLWFIVDIAIVVLVVMA
jgi:MtN3 and saliva related transmembrane protein